MSDRLRRWLQNRLSRKAPASSSRSSPRSDIESPPPLPFLPEPPLGTRGLELQKCADGGDDAIKASSQQASLFFRLLPPELRRRILTYAFGDQAVHIFLDCLRPTRFPVDCHPSHLLPRGFQHGGTSAPLRDVARLSGAEVTILRDGSRSRTWQWWSSVCHQGDPEGRLFVQPHTDTCLTGEAACELWPGKAPGKCQIGCMGWIRSCRQSCREGLDVLYSTNRFFFFQGPLLTHLLRQNELAASTSTFPGPQFLIPPSNLNLVKSLVIRWGFKLFINDQEEQMSERDRLAHDLDLLSATFPGLQKMYVSFDNGIYHIRLHPSQNMDDIDATLMDPIRVLCRRPTHLEELVVSLPTVLFDPLATRAAQHGYPLVKGRTIFDRRCWIPAGNLDAIPNTTELDAQEHSGRDSREAQKKKGFWLARGAESDFGFDWQGNPRIMSQAPSVLH